MLVLHIYMIPVLFCTEMGMFRWKELELMLQLVGVFLTFYVLILVSEDIFHMPGMMHVMTVDDSGCVCWFTIALYLPITMIASGFTFLMIRT